MKDEIVLYQTDGMSKRIEIRLDRNKDTFWLSLNQIAELFERDKSVISRHLKSIFNTNELDKSSVVAKNATTASDGKTYQVEYYNLDAVFYEGQVFDAYHFISNLIRKAKKSIMLIDNYIDERTIIHLAKKNKNVQVHLYCRKINDKLKLDIEKANEQYGGFHLKHFDKSHDRFLIIDQKYLYHIGASLKDLGKKWFAFTKLDSDILEMVVGKLKNEE